MSFIEYFNKGGDIMWVISAALIIEAAIIIERALFYFLNSYSYQKYEKYLTSQLKKNNKINRLESLPANLSTSDEDTGIKKILKKIDQIRLSNSVVFRVADVYLKTIHHPEESRTASVKKVSSMLLNLQERHLNLLALIAQIAPLLGLLGTVTGMIKAFFVIAALGGQVDVTKLAGGISEAMITTAYGLIVAVPAYIFHEMYQKITDNRVENINRMIHLLDEHYHKE